MLFKDKKVLLQRRANTGWNDGKWNLVGGHIEDDETIEQCIIREAKEELNIEIREEDLKVVHCMQHKTDRMTMQFYVYCDKFKGEPEIQAEENNGKVVYKADKLEWFETDKLPNEIIPSAKLAIDSFLKGQHFSQRGYEEKEQENCF